MRTSILLGSLLLIGILVGCSDPASNQLVAVPVTVKAGQPAPDFLLRSSTGSDVSLAAYKGKVIYLDFWASWCGPCKAVIPSQKALWEEYRGKDFVIIGVSLDYTETAWRTYIADEGLDWVQTFDDGQSIRGAAWVYGVQVIPQSYLIDKEGKFIARDLHGDALRDSVDLYVNK